MTPLESQRLQGLGMAYLYNIEKMSIAIFFYGASSSLLVHGIAHKFDYHIKESLLYFSLHRLSSSCSFSPSCRLRVGFFLLGMT